MNVFHAKKNFYKSFKTKGKNNFVIVCLFWKERLRDKICSNRVYKQECCWERVCICFVESSPIAASVDRVLVMLWGAKSNSNNNKTTQQLCVRNFLLSIICVCVCARTNVGFCVSMECEWFCPLTSIQKSLRRVIQKRYPVICVVLFFYFANILHKPCLLGLFFRMRCGGQRFGIGSRWFFALFVCVKQHKTKSICSCANVMALLLLLLAVALRISV